MESDDLVKVERDRKAAVRKSKVDADLDAESADLQEKKGVCVVTLSSSVGCMLVCCVCTAAWFSQAS